MTAPVAVVAAFLSKFGSEAKFREITNPASGRDLRHAKPRVLDALAIERILSGVLAVGFLFAAGLGMQEPTYAGIGRVIGMPAHLSLALVLIRRAGAACLAGA